MKEYSNYLPLPPADVAGTGLMMALPAVGLDTAAAGLGAADPAWSANCSFTFPADERPYMLLTEGQVAPLLFNLTCWLLSSTVASAGTDVLLNVTSSRGEVARVMDGGLVSVTLPPGNSTSQLNTTVEGLKFGRTDLLFSLEAVGLVFEEQELPGYEVIVIKEETKTLGFTILLGLMILIYNFGFGCKVDIAAVRDILRRPVAPALGLCLQFLIMAPLSYGVARALNLDDMAGLGLLAIGCSPGGGGSNVLALLLDADLELSITMTFISTLAAVVMTPMWMYVLGSRFNVSNARLTVPVGNVFLSLAMVVVPVGAGVWLHQVRPPAAKLIGTLLKPATAVIGFTFIALGTWAYYFALASLPWNTVVACTVVPLAGYSLGLGGGFLLRQGRRRAITVALETGYQNLALAMFMISTSLEPPESDFAGVVPVCYTYMGSIPPVIAVLVYFASQLAATCRGTCSNADVTGDVMEMPQAEKPGTPGASGADSFVYTPRSPQMEKASAGAVPIGGPVQHTGVHRRTGSGARTKDGGTVTSVVRTDSLLVEPALPLTMFGPVTVGTLGQENGQSVILYM